MAKNVVDVTSLATPDELASTIANLYSQWKGARAPWEMEKKELRDYLFATDTSKTSNSVLPWKNSTTTPKLCQIRDNLHANYMAALFPTDPWFNWLGDDETSVLKPKVTAIKSFMRNKLRQSEFEVTVSRLLLDWIDTGNCFGEVVVVNEFHTLPDGEVVSIYQGPKLQRISPYDIVFDVTAASFKDAPKITRSILTMGQLEEMALSQTDTDYAAAAIAKCKELRKQVANVAPEQLKSDALAVDGFGNAHSYLTSGMCEILEFEGDLYDVSTYTAIRNRRIVVLDRMFVLQDAPYNSWLGKSNKEHCGWRLRPDNLMAMGPLDNLVGLQYRMDHLENLKADVFDQIACPVMKIKGAVDDFRWGPGEKIFMDLESDVEPLVPDATALNADMQIARIIELMEELAGAPRNAMGIRTPGEKTAYEVSSLDNAAGRIFQNKTKYFESTFLEPLLNQMLVAGRQNVILGDSIAVQDTDTGAMEFLKLTPEDLKAKGKLVPVGARHFAKQSTVVQNLNNLANSGAYMDPAVNVHISGLRLAEILVENLNMGEVNLVQKNVRLYEQGETARIQQTVATMIHQEAGMDSQVLGAELEDPEEMASEQLE